VPFAPLNRRPSPLAPIKAPAAFTGCGPESDRAPIPNLNESSRFLYFVVETNKLACYRDHGESMNPEVSQPKGPATRPEAFRR
jgi:hypothetical protein